MEPNTPGSGSSRPAMRVNASRAAPLRLGAVLLCLFYFVSSINDEAPGTREAERHSDLPGGKALASGHRCPPTPTHPPLPAWAPCDGPGTERARVWSE